MFGIKGLEELATTDELILLVENVIAEYYANVDTLMMDNIEGDLQEALMGEDPNKIKDDPTKFAWGVTGLRMKKYGELFFNKEIASLMDKYNDNEMDKTEYLIRCKIVAGIRDTMGTQEAEPKSE